MKACCRAADGVIRTYQALRIGGNVSTETYSLAARGAARAADHIASCARKRKPLRRKSCTSKN